MGWNGAGNFQRTNGSFSGATVWQDDQNAGFDIVASREDYHDQDLAQGINNCLTKDGQNSPTANLPMNNFRHTGVSDGLARNQYATVAQLQDQAAVVASAVSGTNTITASMSPNISSYVTGARYAFKASGVNTGATTVKLGSAPTVAVQRYGAALTGGEIQTGDMVALVFDGTAMQLVNSTPQPLFIDRTNSRIGVNVTAPANPVDVQCASGNGVGFVSRGRSSDNVGVMLFTDNANSEVARIVSSTTTLNINKTGNNPVVINTNAIDRLTVTGTGQVLMGAASADSRAILAAGSGSGTQWFILNGGSSGTGAGAGILVQNGGSTTVALGGYSSVFSGGAYDATPTLYFTATPKVIGITSGVGDRFMKWSTTTNSWTYDTSSQRFKDNITNCRYGLAAVEAMQPREFDYKYENYKHDVGFVAEELVSIVPEVVGLDSDGNPEAVMYDRLSAVLCKALQELSTKVNEIATRVSALEAS